MYIHVYYLCKIIAARAAKREKVNIANILFEAPSFYRFQFFPSI